MNSKLLSVSLLMLGVLHSCSTSDTEAVGRAVDGAARGYYGGGTTTQPAQPYVAPAPVYTPPAPVYQNPYQNPYQRPVQNPYQRLY